MEICEHSSFIYLARRAKNRLEGQILTEIL